VAVMLPILPQNGPAPETMPAVNAKSPHRRRCGLSL
jgi:hypothetical protein